MFPTLVRFSPIFEENKNIKNILISDIEQQSIFDLKLWLNMVKIILKQKLFGVHTLLLALLKYNKIGFIK